ncbi:bcl-2-interacting killer [Diceros bicornis minor]|uniref:bcl-2-interacting killer n=1 Tax=Diceros bicornis minor TaxID=77932 RepID=UPI0026EF9315|nr:bcl-2-interacting killer [Diceros bicornis minor]
MAFALQRYPQEASTMRLQVKCPCEELASSSRPGAQGRARRPPQTIRLPAGAPRTLPRSPPPPPTRGESEPSRRCRDPSPAAQRPSAQPEPGREEMSQAGPFSRDLFLDTFLHEHGPEAPEVPGMTDLTESSPHSDNPDYVAMRLAFIGDEMEVRWTLPHIAELPGVAVYSLAFTYNQTGLRGVLRSFMDGLTNLRENIRFWSLLTRRDRVSPGRRRGLALPMLLLLLLLLLLGWGRHLLQ